MLDDIQPIVLVGGQSRRFGRDKLREKLSHGLPSRVFDPSQASPAALLVDAPIAALRAVFGPRVALVGRCHSEVSTRADFIIEDNFPGVGPLGGILSALEYARGHEQSAILVLAGDLPNIDAQSIRNLLDAAQARTDAWAIAGQTCGLEPCIAIYRLGMIEPLRQALAADANKSASLVDVLRGLPTARLAICELNLSVAKNVNTPDEFMH